MLASCGTSSTLQVCCQTSKTSSRTNTSRVVENAMRRAVVTSCVSPLLRPLAVKLSALAYLWTTQAEAKALQCVKSGHNRVGDDCPLTP